MSQLKNAMVGGEFDLHFQPVVCPQKQRVCSFKAIAHFDTQRLGMAADSGPDEVLAQIDRHGLATHFDYAMITKTLQASAYLKTSGFPDLKLSVNLSAQTLSEPSFLTVLWDQIAAQRVSPHSLQFEIAETELVAGQVNRDIIPDLAAHGFTFAVDDFISGYSNFSVLAAPHLSVIKVDKTVVQSIHHSDIARRFLCGLLTLAQSLGKQLVVEGVDTAGQYQFLDSIGYNQFQGQYFSPPLTLNELGDYPARFAQTAFPTLFESIDNVSSDDGDSNKPQE